MHLLNRAYIKLYFFVLLLYVFFNKGVAYSYMAEILLVAGIFILFINRNKFEIALDRKQIIIGIFIIIYFFGGSGFRSDCIIIGTTMFIAEFTLFSFRFFVVIRAVK